MPSRRDFSGGYSSLPLELQRPDQVIAAEGCYWSRGLQRWGGTTQAPGDPTLTGVLAVHEYTRFNGGDTITLLLRRTSTGDPELHWLNHATGILTQVGGTLPLWGATAADVKPYMVPNERGVIMGAPGKWPLVFQEKRENRDPEWKAQPGTFRVVSLESLDVRERHPLDWTHGFAKNVGGEDSDHMDVSDPPAAGDPDGILARTFDVALPPSPEYGVWPVDGEGVDTEVEFSDWRHHLVWFESLQTFNHIKLTGDGLHTDLTLLLVDDDGNFVVITPTATVSNGGGTLDVEWDWDEAYAGYHEAERLTFSEGREGEGNYRAMLIFHPTELPPVPEAPPVTVRVGVELLDIFWEKVDLAVSYEYRVFANGAVAGSWTNAMTNTEARVSGLTGDQLYDVEVRARDNRNRAGATGTGSGTPDARIVIRPPDIPSVSFTETLIVVTAGRGTGGIPTSYDIDYRRGTVGGFTRVSNDADGRYNPNVPLNVVLQAQARARNAGGVSDWSPIAQRERLVNTRYSVPGTYTYTALYTIVSRYRVTLKAGDGGAGGGGGGGGHGGVYNLNAGGGNGGTGNGGGG